MNKNTLLLAVVAGIVPLACIHCPGRSSSHSVQKHGNGRLQHDDTLMKPLEEK